MLVERREALIEHLLAMPSPTIDRDIRDYHGFTERAAMWLHQIEAAARQHGLPIASLAASERTAILAVRDGLRVPEIREDRSTSRSQRGWARASLALTRVEKEVRQELSTLDKRLEEAREKIAQLLAVATPSVPIPLPPTEPRMAWLQQVWSSLLGNGETRSLHVYLSALLSVRDRLYLLDGVLNNLLGVSDLERIEQAALSAERFARALARTFEPAGIRSAAQLLDVGATRSGRRQLAKATGLTEEEVHRWVDRADLARVEGLGWEYANLLEAAGVNSVSELRRRRPDRLYARIQQVNKDTEMVERLPAKPLLSKWIETAKALGPKVSH